MIPTLFFSALILLPLAADAVFAVPNQCPQPTTQVPVPTAFFYAHPYDPRYFFTCAHGNAFLLMCPPQLFWNNLLQTCAGNDNQMSPCSSGASLIPHASACQRYYNCTETGPAWNRYFEKFEAECPFPDLFDARELKCKLYDEAYCGPFRVAAKDPCDYLANKCGGAHCEPCSSRLPSCVGFADGTYQHPAKLDSPYKMHCISERLYRILYCSPHTPASEPFDVNRADCQTTWQAHF